MIRTLAWAGPVTFSRTGRPRYARSSSCMPTAVAALLVVTAPVVPFEAEVVEQPDAEAMRSSAAPAGPRTRMKGEWVMTCSMLRGFVTEATRHRTADRSRGVATALG